MFLPMAATPTSTLIPPETKGPRPGRKSMSVVGTLYSVDPYVRTPEQMLEMLFRDGPPPDDEPRRPRPCGKHVWAALDDEVVDTDGSLHASPDCTSRSSGCRTSGTNAIRNITSRWCG